MSTSYTLKHSLRPGFEPVLRLLIDVCGTVGCAYFVAGATARDIVLFHVFGRDPGRQTKDIDTAIMVADWSEYQSIRSALVAAGLTETRETHRLHHQSSGLPVDIIPFGGIASAEGEIAWPPEFETVMSVAGFEEAFAAAITVKLDASTELKVCSMAGLALLKLVAWRERRQQSNKDASDFLTLLDQYPHLQKDRLWESFLPLEQLEYKDSRLGAFLLGYDVSALLSPMTREALEVMKQQEKMLLSDALIRSQRRQHVIPPEPDDCIQIEQHIDDFFAGLRAGDPLQAVSGE
ncbi:nucleotidyl transferase AbiEii/AbiGii toxin family protein [Pokkaliibacter sp. MBI-7]|uniref:nucleotidyl transferase AbiEii/AbiGii toxin family protein n=1 Tax=Pokkaliibacter sp. MBI-7 TaxID=3040600 RepID=UPI002447EB3A|nr:nucleotidyl transferase AbiEii/AbiGii toxin family protein [Pokkaliibacter sp. MBI-7]MDH2433775.1 nucleotidyl transferase AbiEii/AbiGii toxin family protein [Pokkaliibacter sp. MBI-7]